MYNKLGVGNNHECANEVVQLVLMSSPAGLWHALQEDCGRLS